MDFYELALFLHVVAVIAWLGSGLCVNVLVALADRAGDTDGLRRLLAGAAQMKPVFAGSSVLAFAAGIALVIDGPWDFGTPWVIIGLVGFLSSGALVPVFTGHSWRAIELAEGDGTLGPEAHGEARRFMTFARIDLVILFMVVAAMTLKPTTDDLGLLIAMALIAAAAVAYVLRGAPAPAAARAAEA